MDIWNESHNPIFDAKNFTKNVWFFENDQKNHVFGKQIHWHVTKTILS